MSSTSGLRATPRSSVGLALDDLVFHQQCHIRHPVRRYHSRRHLVGTEVPLHAHRRDWAHDDLTLGKQSLRHSVNRYRNEYHSTDHVPFIKKSTSAARD